MRHYLNIPEHGIRASYPLTLSILNHKTGVDEMNELIKGTVDHQQTWSGSISDEIRCNILPWMKTPVFVKLEKEPAPQQQNVPKDEAHKKINPPLMVPGPPKDTEIRDVFEPGRLVLSRAWADHCNRRMMDKDMCAPGMLRYNNRKLEKEQRQRATEHLRNREESRTLHAALHAALAFDNTTGFTGMAHVDTLRGQL